MRLLPSRSPMREVRIALSRAGSAPQEATTATRPAPFSMDPFRQEREAHQRALGDLKRKERSSAAAAVEDDSLKPAVSLTRVDSDTLKVCLRGCRTSIHADTGRGVGGCEAGLEQRKWRRGTCSSRQHP